MLEKKLFHFNSDCQFSSTIINDTLLGGKSKSCFEINSEHQAVFSGELSDAIKQCFTSVRLLKQNFSLEGFDGIMMKLIGDGRKYKCHLKSDAQHDDIEYEFEFIAKPNEWMLIKIPFNKFRPTYRGHHLHNIPSITSNSIRMISFSVDHYTQTGKFKLTIDWINAYENAKTKVRDYVVTF